MRRFILASIMLLSIASLIAGCTLFDIPIHISPPNAVIDVGQTKTFYSYDENNNLRNSYWSLSGNTIGYLSTDYGTSTVFHATNPGNGSINTEKKDGTITDSAEITVNSTNQVLTKIVIDPASWNFEVTAGYKMTFTATGYDQNDNEMDINPTWSLSNPVGTLSTTIGSECTFTPTSIGEANIIAKVGSISATSSLKVYRVVSFAIVPESAAMAIGEEITFKTRGVDTQGGVWIYYANWSLSNDIGTLTPITTLGTEDLICTSDLSKDSFLVPDGIYGWKAILKATKNGTADLTATFGTLTAKAPIVVGAYTPVLTSIVVSPDPTTVEKGKTQGFTATGKDQNGNTMTISPLPTWTVTGGVGTVSPTSGSSTTTFNATTVGSGTVVATSGSVSGHAHVTVVDQTPVLTSIVVTPDPATVEKGKTQGFTATGKDQNGNTMTISPLPTWTVTGGVGTVTPTSGSSTTTFNATTVGSGTVVATSGSVSGHAHVTVVDTQVLTSIVVTPDPVNIGKGSTQVFTATGKDQNGNTMTISPAPTWSVTGSIGNFSPSSGISTTFTATTVGSGTIVATSGSVSGHAHVTVVDTQVLTSIVVTPDPVTVAKGKTQGFTATGKDQNGNTMTISPLPTWTVTGGVGTVSPTSGSNTTTFSATAVGSGTVVATSGSVNGHAHVTVEIERLATSISIEPSSLSTYIGDSTVFYAYILDQYGEVMDVSPTWTLYGSIGTRTPSSGQSTTFMATTLGNGSIKASYSGLSATAQINVNDKMIPTTIQISPSSWTMTGPTKVFTATVKDQKGIDITSSCWFTNSLTGSGSVNQVLNTFEYVASTPGTSATLTITAYTDFGSVDGSASITIPASVPGSVVVDPDYYKLKIGRSKTFNAIVYDQYGYQMQGYKCRWYTLSKVLSESSTSVTITGEAPANVCYDLYAKAGSAVGSAMIDVLPAPIPSSILVNVAAWTMTSKTKTFSVTYVEDQYGDELSGCSYNWKISSSGGLSDVASLSSSGSNTTLSIDKFVGSTIQSEIIITVSNSYGSKAWQIDVTVPYCYCKSVTVSPSSYTFKVLDIATFTGKSTCQYGHTNEIVGSSAKWTTSGTYAGTLSSSTGSSVSLNALKTGSGSITCSYGGYSSSASIVVNPLTGVHTGRKPAGIGWLINVFFKYLQFPIEIGEVVHRNAYITGMDVNAEVQYSAMDELTVTLRDDDTGIEFVLWYKKVGYDKILYDNFYYTSAFNGLLVNNRNFTLFVDRRDQWIGGGSGELYGFEYKIYWKLEDAR